MLPDGDLLLRRRKSGTAEQFIGVEKNLPVVVSMRVRPHRENGTEQIEIKYFHVGRRVGNDVGNLQKLTLQLRDRRVDVDGTIQLRGAVHAARGCRRDGSPVKQAWLTILLL